MNDHPTKFRAEASPDGETLHLYAMGPIADQVWYGDEVTPRWLIDALNGRDPRATTLHLHLNSYGGSVFAGLALHNIIRGCGLRTVATVEGIAASAATLLLCAADERIVPSSAYVMIHNPWTFAEGESEDLRKAADLLDRLRGTLVGIYRTRTNLSTEELEELLDEETWLTGEEALKHGFATSVGEAIDVAAAVRPWTSRPGLRLPAALCRPEAGPPDAGREDMALATTLADLKAQLTDPVKLAKALDVLTAKPEATAAEVVNQVQAEAAQAELEAAAAKVPQLEADLAAAKAEVEKLKAEVAAAKTAALGAAPHNANPQGAADADAGNILDQFGAITNSTEKAKFYAQHKAAIDRALFRS